MDYRARQVWVRILIPSPILQEMSFLTSMRGVVMSILWGVVVRMNRHSIVLFLKNAPNSDNTELRTRHKQRVQ